MCYYCLNNISYNPYFNLPEVIHLASTHSFNFIDPSSNPDGGEKYLACK